MKTRKVTSHLISNQVDQHLDYYSQAFELLASVCQIKSEEDAIQEIRHIFSIVFQTQDLIYIRLMGDLVLSIYPPQTPVGYSREMVHWAKNRQQKYRLSETDNCLTLRISNQTETLGVLEFRQSAAPPISQQTLEAGQMLASLCGMVISNIRAHQKLVEDERLLHLPLPVDTLTGFANRRFFFEIAEVEFKRSMRYNRPLSAILVELDDFKTLSDIHGIRIGNSMLAELARVFNKELRESDIRVRMGGEEFLILLPETNLKYAQSLAERLRCRIAETSIQMLDKTLFFTISLGLVSLDHSIQTMEDLIRCADQALFQAKRNGKNQVAIWAAPLVEYEPVYRMKETDYRIGFY